MIDIALPGTAPADPALGRVGRALARIAGAQGLEVAELTELAALDPREQALADGTAGAEWVDRRVDAGARLLLLTGDDSPSALVVIAALLDLEPVTALGTTATPGWAESLVAIRAGLTAARAQVGDPRRLLAAAGEPATLADAIVQAAVRRTPVLLDGSAQAAAGVLVADRLAPGVAHWCTATTAPPSPGAAAALADLWLEPLLDLELTTRGEVLAVALLRAAVAGA